MTGISGSIGVYFQNARVRFLCPLPIPLASLWCIVLDADSDDSAPLASWALTVCPLLGVAPFRVSGQLLFHLGPSPSRSTCRL